jgi:hypothetical protein
LDGDEHGNGRYLRAVSDIDVERLQASLNRFTNRWLENVAPLIVDGDKGFLTNRRIMTVKWYLGYLGERDGRVTSRFRQRTAHHAAGGRHAHPGQGEEARGRWNARKLVLRLTDRPRRPDVCTTRSRGG